MQTPNDGKAREDEAVLASGCSSSSHSARPRWADLPHEDSGSEGRSSQWVNSEGGACSDRLRRRKIVNKALGRDLFAGRGTPGAGTPRGEHSGGELSGNAVPSLHRKDAASSSRAGPGSCQGASSSDFDGSASASSAQSGRSAAPPPREYTAAELAELLPQVPLDEQGQQSSIGSIGHGAGSCRPCVFTSCKIGCQTGLLCEFCHLPHRRKGKSRPCKGKRDRHKKLIERMSETVSRDGEDSDVGTD